MGNMMTNKHFCLPITFAKSFQVVIEFFAKLYSHFLAWSLKAKGTKCSLTSSSPNCGIFIITHTSSNSFMKKYASSDSRPWYFGRVFMNCDLSLNLSISFRKLNARWKRCPNNIEAILQGYCLCHFAIGFSWWNVSS